MAHRNLEAAFWSLTTNVAGTTPDTASKLEPALRLNSVFSGPAEEKKKKKVPKYLLRRVVPGANGRAGYQGLAKCWSTRDQQGVWALCWLLAC